MAKKSTSKKAGAGKPLPLPKHNPLMDLSEDDVNLDELFDDSEKPEDPGSSKVDLDAANKAVERARLDAEAKAKRDADERVEQERRRVQEECDRAKRLEISLDTTRKQLSAVTEANAEQQKKLLQRITDLEEERKKEKEEAEKVRLAAEKKERETPPTPPSWWNRVTSIARKNVVRIAAGVSVLLLLLLLLAITVVAVRIGGPKVLNALKDAQASATLGTITTNTPGAVGTDTPKGTDTHATSATGTTNHLVITTNSPVTTIVDTQGTGVRTSGDLNPLPFSVDGNSNSVNIIQVQGIYNAAPGLLPLEWPRNIRSQDVKKIELPKEAPEDYEVDIEVNIAEGQDLDIVYPDGHWKVARRVNIPDDKYMIALDGVLVPKRGNHPNGKILNLKNVSGNNGSIDLKFIKLAEPFR